MVLVNVSNGVSHLMSYHYQEVFVKLVACFIISLPTQSISAPVFFLFFFFFYTVHMDKQTIECLFQEGTHLIGRFNIFAPRKLEVDALSHRFRYIFCHLTLPSPSCLFQIPGNMECTTRPPF